MATEDVFFVNSIAQTIIFPSFVGIRPVVFAITFTIPASANNVTL